MLRIKEFAFTAYPVVNLARPRRFYEGVLGLRTSLEYIKDDFGWVEYESGGATFALAAVSSDWKPSETGALVAFEVEDFKASVAALKDTKVPLKPSRSRRPAVRCASCWIRKVTV